MFSQGRFHPGQYFCCSIICTTSAKIIDIGDGNVHCDLVSRLSLRVVDNDEFKKKNPIEVSYLFNVVKELSENSLVKLSLRYIRSPAFLLW